MTAIPARKGSYKARAINEMRRAGHDGVHVNRLLRSVYGDDDPALKPALSMVLNGIQITIKRTKAPVRLVRMKTEGSCRYALVTRD